MAADPDHSNLPTRRGALSRWITRLLAVAAMAACVVAVLLIVQTYTDDGGGDGDRQEQRSQNGKKGGKQKDQVDVPDTYTVQEGDNLTTISDQFRVPEAKIERLNPDIDPQTLSIGQTINLK